MSADKDEIPPTKDDYLELPPSSKPIDQDSSSDVAKQISVMPSVVVGKILSYLSWKDKLSAAAAIPLWNDHLRTPDAWTWFCMDDVYASSEHQIEQLSKVNEMTRWCIRHYGHFFQNCFVVVVSCTDGSAFQLLDDVKTYCRNIKTLRIYHATRTRFSNQEQLDKYVSALRQVIAECRAVRYFTLCNMDYVPFNWSEGLTELLRSLAVDPLLSAIKELELYHVNNTVLPVLHLASFVNLRKLMCPIHVLNTEIVVGLRHLRQLFLVNSSDSSVVSFCEVHRLNWRAIATAHPALEVHYLYWTFLRKSLIVPNPLARSVVIGERCEFSTCVHEVINSIVESYGKTLRRFVQQNTFSISKNELPSLYATLVKGCPLLHTFLVSVPIPAAAVSLVAANRRLRNLWVQDEKISFKFYPRSETCKFRTYYDDVEYVDWWETTIGSLDSLQQQLAKFLGFPWKPLDELEMMEKVRMLTRF